MKITKISFSALLLSVLIFACVKREVIPAPVVVVELKPHFTGEINGTNVEYTDDVDGFNGENTQTQQILTSPEQSRVKYYCNMVSNLINTSIKVGVGNVYWDAGAIEKPSLEQFNDFFTGILSPNTMSFGDFPNDGFEVEYKDAFGNTWNSDELSVNSQNVIFTKISNESDNTGDYCKFTAEFSCHVYRDVIVLGLPERDSIRIDNAVFEGWFLR
ncbi:MAG: hypothetical protein V4622_01485 [Bacteroidota bacterium]